MDEYVFENDEVGEDITPQKSRYTFMSGKELKELDTPPKIVLLEPILRKESLVLITGSRGIGKTLFTLPLVSSVSNGVDFCNMKIGNKGNCLYVDGELPVYLLKERIDDEKYDKITFLSSGVDMTNYSILKPDFQKVIIEFCIENKIDLICFDNKSCLTMGIDENSKRETDLINEFLLTLRRLGLCVVLIHHTGKSGDEQRGSSGLVDIFDVWISLKKENNSVVDLTLDYKKYRYEPIEFSTYSRFLFNGVEWYEGSNRLTDTEEEVLELLGSGKTQKEVSKITGLSQGQVSKIKKRYTTEGNTIH